MTPTKTTLTKDNDCYILTIEYKGKYTETIPFPISQKQQAINHKNKIDKKIKG